MTLKLNQKFGLSRNAIKAATLAAMTLNHIAHAFLDPGSKLYAWMLAVGYFTAVTMCYFAVEGFEKTGDIRKYILRMVGFSLLSQLPYSLMIHAAGVNAAPLNMLFNLTICLLCLQVLNSALAPNMRGVCLAVLLTVSVFCDWNAMAPAFTLVFWRMKEQKNGRAAAYAVCTALFAVVSIIQYVQGGAAFAGAIFNAVRDCTGMVLSGITVCLFYTGKKGRGGRAAQYFFYVYYPLHLLILYLLISHPYLYK